MHTPKASIPQSQVSVVLHGNPQVSECDLETFANRCFDLAESSGNVGRKIRRFIEQAIDINSVLSIRVVLPEMVDGRYPLTTYHFGFLISRCLEAVAENENKLEGTTSSIRDVNCLTHEFVLDIATQWNVNASDTLEVSKQFLHNLAVLLCDISYRVRQDLVFRQIENDYDQRYSDCQESYAGDGVTGEMIEHILNERDANFDRLIGGNLSVIPGTPLLEIAAMMNPGVAKAVSDYLSN